MPVVQSSRSRYPLAVLLGAGLWLALTASGQAQERYRIDWDGPIIVEAVEAWADSEQRLTRLTGDIRFDHQQWRMRADTAQIDGPLDAPDAVTITGTPAIMTLRATEDRPELEAIGTTVEYSRANDRLVVSGGATLSEGRRRFAGDRLEYQLATRKLISVGPVKMRIEPKPRP
ncbi:MAG: LptA/OstA family protein [Xanthomonadaceae bacterium]|nr:LptA/OstA family protein [Xanthomonadaceae bacterium]